MPLEDLSDTVSKGYRDGTHRVVSPEETLERVRPWMPAMGITRIANVTGLDTVGLPVVMVCRPNSRSLSVSQGKGLSLAAAKASGLMESIEFFHAERIDKPLRLASHRDLQFSHELIDVAGLPRLAVSPYHDEHRILWIEGWDLLEGRAVWLPYETVHMDYRLPFPPGSGCFAMSSNGLASGNHIQEAIEHALCEVIERDATTLWIKGGTVGRNRTRIDLDSVTMPRSKELIDTLTGAGLLVAAWNTTTDIGVPCIVCEIVDATPNSARPLGASAGMGCHTTAEVAMLRALTEAVQGRLTRISSSRDDIPRGDYELNRNPDVLAAIRKQFLEAEPTVDFGSVPNFESDKFGDDLSWLLARLQAAGIRQVVAVDLTRHDYRVPVVRVIVPGLEAPHDSPGYVPGPRARRAAEAVAT